MLHSTDEKDRTFSTDDIFYYRHREKMRSGLFLILTLLGLLLLVVALFFLNNLIPNLIPSRLKDWIVSTGVAVQEGRSWGIALIAFTSGLFFFFIPPEAIYFRYLLQGISPLPLFGIFYLSLFLAQSINYGVGYRLNRLSKIVIPARKFYRLKGLLNRYGPVAILVINALPLPSPALSVILGAFRYNLIRFYFFTMMGQAILYGSMTLGSFFFHPAAAAVGAP